MSEVLLQVKDIKQYFPIRGGLLNRVTGHVKAVDGVSFEIKEGESFGLVGESGCGKTTFAKTILRLIEPTDGSIILNGEDFCALQGKDLQAARRDMQLVFQDPFSSLDPKKKVGDLIVEPLLVHGLIKKEEKAAEAERLLQLVGLQPTDIDRYPHEFSGGQRQRIGIARAIALKPKLLVCDEPVSALDVSIQSQVLNLLKSLQEQFGITLIFVAHGLPVVKYMCDRLAVMYLGKVVELGDCESIFESPSHPYTKALMSAIPMPDPDLKKKMITLQGEIPSPANPPSGCRFHTRCSQCMGICKEKEPELKEVSPGHFVACHLMDHG